MKRSAINPVSKKRQALKLERREMVKRILHDRPNCEAGLEHCSGRSVDVHEVLNRSHRAVLSSGAQNRTTGLFVGRVTLGLPITRERAMNWGSRNIPGIDLTGLVPLWDNGTNEVKVR